MLDHDKVKCTLCGEKFIHGINTLEQHLLGPSVGDIKVFATQEKTQGRENFFTWILDSRLFRSSNYLYAHLILLHKAHEQSTKMLIC